MADRWHESKIVSNHVTRIVPSYDKDQPDPGYLLVALSHPILGRPLIIRNAFGTEVPEIVPDDLARIPIPRISDSAERKIGRLASEATDEWAKAREMEAGAVGILESELQKILN